MDNRIPWIVFKIFGHMPKVYINHSAKGEKERKRLVRMGWASLKEGLVQVLSLGHFDTDISLDEAFKVQRERCNELDKLNQESEDEDKPETD